MFRKLRLRLTLINVLVMAALFILFVAGTYMVMQSEIFSQSEQLMQMIATEAGSESIHNVFQHDNQMARYFVVKTNAAGSITEASSDLPLAPEHLTPLVEKTLQKTRPGGEVEWQDQYYTYLRAPLSQGQGFALVFVNVERERDILRFLLAALAIAGLISLALAFYGSLFLADRAMTPIKQSWQRQRDFVADASHELRTPLAVIQTNLELVRGNPEDTVVSQETWLENIQIETKRMTRLVNDLLFLARADSQQQRVEMTEFPLDKALRDALEPFMPMAGTKGIKLELPDLVPHTFYGDENRLKQLAVILVDNAIKHTPPGGEVCLKLQSHAGGVEITVTDTGDGIEPEHLDKIFERFYRVDKARSVQQGGTGLGLAIADWIVKSHHGTITASSIPGQETVFTVNLPTLEA